MDDEAFIGDQALEYTTDPFISLPSITHCFVSSRMVFFPLWRL